MAVSPREVIAEALMDGCRVDDLEVKPWDCDHYAEADLVLQGLAEAGLKVVPAHIYPDIHTMKSEPRYLTGEQTAFIDEVMSNRVPLPEPPLPLDEAGA